MGFNKCFILGFFLYLFLCFLGCFDVCGSIKYNYIFILMILIIVGMDGMGLGFIMYYELFGR